MTLVAVMMAGLTVGAHGAVARGYKPFNRPTVVAVRRATSLQPRITLAQDDVMLDRAGVRALSVEFAVLPQYDVTFVGMDLTDVATGALIRRAYVVPWEWRSMRKPWFRFATLTTPPGRVRMTLFTEWPGVHPSLLRADCPRPSIDAGMHLCVEAHE